MHAETHIDETELKRILSRHFGAHPDDINIGFIQIGTNPAGHAIFKLDIVVKT